MFVLLTYIRMVSERLSLWKFCRFSWYVKEEEWYPYFLYIKCKCVAFTCMLNTHLYNRKWLKWSASIVYILIVQTDYDFLPWLVKHTFIWKQAKMGKHTFCVVAPKNNRNNSPRMKDTMQVSRFKSASALGHSQVAV